MSRSTNSATGAPDYVFRCCPFFCDVGVRRRKYDEDEEHCNMWNVMTCCSIIMIVRQKVRRIWAGHVARMEKTMQTQTLAGDLLPARTLGGNITLDVKEDGKAWTEFTWLKTDRWRAFANAATNVRAPLTNGNFSTTRELLRVHGGAAG